MALNDLQHALYEMIFDRDRRNQFFDGQYNLAETWGLTPEEEQQIRDVGFQTLERQGRYRIDRMPKTFPFVTRIITDYFKNGDEIKYRFAASQIFKDHINDCEMPFDRIFYHFLKSVSKEYNFFDFPAFEEVLELEYQKWVLANEVGFDSYDSKSLSDEEREQVLSNISKLSWTSKINVKVCTFDVDVVGVLDHMTNFTNQRDSVHVTAFWLRIDPEKFSKSNKYYVILFKDESGKIRQFKVGSSEYIVLRNLLDRSKTLDDLVKNTELDPQQITAILSAFFKANLIKPEVDGFERTA